MTVSTSYAPLTYNGNGSTTALSVTWQFFTGSLKVYAIDADGVETLKTISTHYTVSGGTDADGLPAVGTVTMLTAPASGTSTRIERVTPKTQSSSWTNSGAFQAKALEAALDRVTLIAQEGGSGAPGNGNPGDTIDLVTAGATDYYDADNKIIRNVASPTASTDAVNKSYGDANYGGAAAIAAAASATSAASSATAAAASEADAEAALAIFQDLWQGQWLTATAYTKIQEVLNDNAIYICTVAHTSGASTEPGTGASWDDYWDLQVTAPGGDVTAASAFGTDNRLLRSDGTGKGAQASPVSVDDSGNATGFVQVSATTFDGGHVDGDTGLFTTLDIGHASDTTLSRAAAGELAVEGTRLKKVGLETIWVPAAAMTPRTTNGAASGTTELTTNDVMLRTLDFDTTTEEGAGFWVAFPKSWNLSTVTFAAHWTAASGSGGVAWGLAAYSFSDDDAMDTAVSGQQIVTDTLITANDMHVTSTSSAITIGGTPAVGDAVYFEITREVANGSDTLGVDARLLGVRIFFTSSASTDA